MPYSPGFSLKTNNTILYYSKAKRTTSVLFEHKFVPLFYNSCKYSCFTSIRSLLL